jgi:hypothetical protein
MFFFYFIDRLMFLKKHNVSETRSVSVIRFNDGDTWFYLTTEAIPVYETLCFLETIDDRQNPKTYFFQMQYTIVRILELIFTTLFVFTINEHKDQRKSLKK